MKRFLDTREAAEYVGMPVRSFEARYQILEIPYYRVSGRLRFLPAELDAWLKSSCREMPVNEKVQRIINLSQG